MYIWRRTPYRWNNFAYCHWQWTISRTTTTISLPHQCQFVSAGDDRQTGRCDANARFTSLRPSASVRAPVMPPYFLRRNSPTRSSGSDRGSEAPHDHLTNRRERLSVRVRPAGEERREGWFDKCKENFGFDSALSPPPRRRRYEELGKPDGRTRAQERGSFVHSVSRASLSPTTQRPSY